MAHQEVALDLLERVEDDPDKDQQRRTTEELSESPRDTDDTSEGRHDSHDSEEEGTGEGDAVHDRIEVVLRSLARLHTGDEPIVTLQVVGHLRWVDRDRCVEVGEEEDEDREDQVVPNARYCP